MVTAAGRLREASAHLNASEATGDASPTPQDNSSAHPLGLRLPRSGIVGRGYSERSNRLRHPHLWECQVRPVS